MGNQPGKAQVQVHSGKPKKFVHWKSAERPSPPGRPNLIPISDQQPDVITLKWSRPQLDGGSPITGYIVEHRRMGSPHWVRATPTPVGQCEVSISGLEPGWRYQFRAMAENIVGKSDPSELSDPLTVTLQRNAISVPRFLNELKDTQAVENERVEMRVSVLGQPVPEINWFKDGFEIFSSRRTKIVNDNDASVLIIHQAALTDEGEIKCTATNRAGHVVTRARLKVEAPPKIRLPRNYEDGLIVEADEILRLKVGVAGQPQPEVLWSHEGQKLTNGGRYELITTEKNSQLRIDNVRRSDRGEYHIRATNTLGADVASFLVTVTSKPDSPGKVKLAMSRGKSVTLSWTTPIDDGGCKIGNYIVEYFRIGWNVWLKAATTRQLTTVLNDLIEGSEYKFRVKAENPYGVSEPSDESDTLFIPDPKRGITKPSDGNAETSADRPVPPRRKTLSPSRGAPDEIRGVSPNRQAVEIIDNTDLHREMSYGTSNDVLIRKDVRKSPTTDNRQPPPLPPKHSSQSQTVPLTIKHMSERKEENEINVGQKLEKYFQRSPMANRKDVKQPSPKKEEPTALERSHEPVNETVNEKVQTFLDAEVQVETKNNSMDIAPTPTIHISAPLSETKTGSEHDENKHDEVHTSNEFMLVFYPNSTAKDNEKQDSFDLDLEEALSPPAISISSPDLWVAENQYLQTFPIRRSVSSTELLYERAMARFYEAVELEEAGKSRKVLHRDPSVDAPLPAAQPHIAAQTTRKRLGSMSEAERLSFEKRSELRRRSTDFVSHQDFNIPTKWDSRDSVSNLKKNEFSRPNMQLHKQDSTDNYSDDVNMTDENPEYGSDYTASTASLSEDSMEKFKSEVMARSFRTRSTSADVAELDTYHPRDMSAGVFTPYRSPTPEQSAICLNRPVPLPDPSFVPKPILKRPSKENVLRDEEPLRDEVATSRPGLTSFIDDNAKDEVREEIAPKEEIEPEKKDKEKSRGIMGLFKRDKNPSPRKETTPPTTKPALTKADEIEAKRKAKEAEERHKLEMEKVAEEEAKVAVDHYSDIVREIGATRKYTMPIYLNKDELKKAAEKAAIETPTTTDDVYTALEEQEILRAPAAIKPKLSLSERKQLEHVQNASSKLSVTKVHIAEDSSQPSTPTPGGDESVRGRSKVIKVKRIIKKRVPSRTRSRESSSNRPSSAMGGPPPPPKVESPPPTPPIQTKKRSVSRTRPRNESKSPGPLNRRLIPPASITSLEVVKAEVPPPPPPKSAEELTEEAHEKVRSAVSYITDLGLFIVACYVYIFKDARLVLPILALMVYRQLGEAIRDMIPDWMKRKKS